MAIRRAMLLPSRFIDEKDCDKSDDSCAGKCLIYCMPPLPPLANPPPPPSDEQGSHHGSLLIIIFSILAAIFLLVTYYTIIKRYCNRRIAAARPTPALITTVHHEDHDENQDPTNYIWYVTTVGLDESVINSIAVYKYNKGDGLIDGTDCSVCLSEFHEDESLRLLPKCNHAFHLPCIDTWLRSHVNCPLCRANVVSSQPGPSLPAPVSSSSAEAEETQVENSRRIDGGGGSGRFMSARSFLRADEAESGADEGRGDTESAKGRGPSPHPNCVFRVQSDLVLNHRLGDSGLETTDDGAEPVRRSVSMDSSAAAMICISLENLHPVYSEGSSSSMAVASSGMKRIVPKHRRNPSFFKLMGSCSKGSFLQKGPVAMKRSLSAGGKLLLSRHSRSRNSILPL